MKHSHGRLRSLIVASLVVPFFLTVDLVVHAQMAKAPSLGMVKISADESEAGPGYLSYKNAHATGKNGSTLDADLLKTVEPQEGQVGATTASGHVKAVYTDAVSKRTYTVTCDQAVYDPTKDTIELTGGVTIVVDSNYTEGPLTQSGTSATIYLGTGPDYPKIDMHQIHSNFTLKQ